MDNDTKNNDQILNIEETLDGNFQITVNGDYLRENIPPFGSKEQFIIDLNLSKHIRKIHASIINRTMSYCRHSRELLKENLKNVTSELQQPQNNEVKTFKAVQSFFKKYGLKSLSVEMINSFVSDLVKQARDKNNPNNKEAKDKIKKLAVAMTFTSRKKMIYNDYTLPEASKELKELAKKLPKNFSGEIKLFCTDCTESKNCLKDFPTNLKGCNLLIKHLENEFPEIVNEALNILKIHRNRSRYIEEEMREKFSKDRGETNELIKYLLYMENLK